MILPTQKFLNPRSEKEFTLNLSQSPAEKGGGNLSRDYSGTRTSVSFFPLQTINKWNSIALNYIERKDTDASANPFTVFDSGFYILGFDFEFIADKINDFALEVRIYNNTSEEVVSRCKIRTLVTNKLQKESHRDFVYLSKGDVLELQVHHSKGAINVDYASMYSFRIDDEYDDLPITPYINNFWYLGDSGNSRVDEIGNNNLVSKNNPTNTLGVLGQGTQFNSSNRQALFNPDINPVEYKDGFTISGYIKLVGEQKSYAVLAAKWKGNNNSLEDQFILYHDHVSKKFVFGLRQTNNVYKFIKSKNSFVPEEFNKLSVSFDNNNKSVSLYLNGKIQQSTKIIGFSDNTNQDFSVGAYNVTEDNPLEHSDCIVDSLLISRFPYAADNIKALYNDGNPIDYSEFLKRESESGLGTGSGNNSGPNTFNAADITFDNNSANILGNPNNVQDAIDRIDDALDNLHSSNFLSFKRTIFNNEWILDNNINMYYLIIPAGEHMLSNPDNIQIAKVNNDTIFYNCLCHIEVDIATKDIKLLVNGQPDGRFMGQVSAISI